MDIIYFSFVFVLILQIKCSVCPTAFLPLHNLCYWLTSTADTWYAGNATCIDNGGAPASFPDVNSYVYVVNTVDIKGSSENIWIGVNDLDSEGDWKNYDGSDLLLLDFMYDYKTEGSWNGRDALAIIPTENCIWRERRETIDMFIMLCVKNITGVPDDTCDYTVQTTFTTNQESASVISTTILPTANYIDIRNQSSTPHQETASTFYVTTSTSNHSEATFISPEISSPKYNKSDGFVMYTISVTETSLETMSEKMNTITTGKINSLFQGSIHLKAAYTDNSVDIYKESLISTSVKLSKLTMGETSINNNTTSFNHKSLTNAINISRSNFMKSTAVLETSFMKDDPMGSSTAVLETSFIKDDPMGSSTAVLETSFIKDDPMGSSTAVLETSFIKDDPMGSSTAVLETSFMKDDHMGSISRGLQPAYIFSSSTSSEMLTLVGTETADIITETLTIAGIETNNPFTETLTPAGTDTFDFISETSSSYMNKNSLVDNNDNTLTNNSLVTSTYKYAQRQTHITSSVSNTLSIVPTSSSKKEDMWNKTEISQLAFNSLLLDSTSISTSGFRTNLSRSSVLIKKPSSNVINTTSPSFESTTTLGSITESVFETMVFISSVLTGKVVINSTENNNQIAATSCSDNMQEISTLGTLTKFMSIQVTSISKLNAMTSTHSMSGEFSGDQVTTAQPGKNTSNITGITLFQATASTDISTSSTLETSTFIDEIDSQLLPSISIQHSTEIEISNEATFLGIGISIILLNIILIVVVCWKICNSSNEASENNRRIIPVRNSSSTSYNTVLPLLNGNTDRISNSLNSLKYGEKYPNSVLDRTTNNFGKEQDFGNASIFHDSNV